MREQHPHSLEKVGVGLVCSVETYRGCNIELVKKQSGFNGLSTNKDGEVRKIEVKSMEKSFNWIAISGLIAIDKLFFERDYWIYFVLLPQNYIVMTKGLPFIKRQLSFTEKKRFCSQHSGLDENDAEAYQGFWVKVSAQTATQVPGSAG
jgi:hypothetical protein